VPAINDPTNLRRIALFRDMTLADLAVLNGLMRRHVLPAGSRVQLAEQIEDTTYVVHSGIVRIVSEQSDGTELIVALLGPGDVIGAETIGSADGAHALLPFDQVSLFWIDRTVFEECVRTMPDLSANLTAVLGRRVRLSGERIEALAGMDVRARLVRHLLLLAREFGEPDSTDGAVRIPLRLTQTDLGRLVGASRVRVNHAVSELSKRGVLETRGGHCLVISDVSALEKLR
jgi:CRP/FNR family transcriptional regulator, cyclic AMP receptor protein